MKYKKPVVKAEIRQAGKCGANAYWWICTVPSLNLTLGSVIAKTREVAIKKAKKEFG